MRGGAEQWELPSRAGRGEGRGRTWRWLLFKVEMMEPESCRGLGVSGGGEKAPWMAAAGPLWSPLEEAAWHPEMAPGMESEPGSPLVC